MAEREAELVAAIEKANELLMSTTWAIDKWKRKLADKTLVKKQTEEVMSLRQ